MADVSINRSDHSFSHYEEDKTKVENEIDSGEDYSSGSDRSVDAEDTDIYHGSDQLQDFEGSSSWVAERRKKRHGSHGSRRHKGGSRHKNRGFHPYLDPQEQLQLKRKSQELKEKENAAAVVRQEGESRFINFPVAPFNSTQFLMDEHDSGSPASIQRTPSSSKLSDDTSMLHSVASTPAESQHEVLNLERKDKEFTDIYTTVHAESLQSLPKDELVKNLMSLEEKVAALQKKVAEAEQQKRQNDDSGESHGSTTATSIPNGDNIVSVKKECGSNANFNQSISMEVSRPTICVGDMDIPAVPPVTSEGCCTKVAV